MFTCLNFQTIFLFILFASINKNVLLYLKWLNCFDKKIENDLIANLSMIFENKLYSMSWEIVLEVNI